MMYIVRSVNLLIESIYCNYFVLHISVNQALVKCKFSKLIDEYKAGSRNYDQEILTLKVFFERSEN